jgi:hypothetical protein
MKHMSTAEVTITRSTLVPSRSYVKLDGETLGWVDKNTDGWASVVSLGGTGRIVGRGDSLRREAILNVVHVWNSAYRTTPVKAAFKGETF